MVGTAEAIILITSVVLMFIMPTYIAEKIKVTIPFVHGNIEIPTPPNIEKNTENQLICYYVS